MSMSSDTPHDNLTLSEADLAACRPIVGEGGHVLRALCPFHGSDRHRAGDTVTSTTALSLGSR